jgi:hypothetical protein
MMWLLTQGKFFDCASLFVIVRPVKILTTTRLDHNGVLNAEKHILSIAVSAPFSSSRMRRTRNAGKI